MALTALGLQDVDPEQKPQEGETPAQTVFRRRSEHRHPVLNPLGESTWPKNIKLPAPAGLFLEDKGRLTFSASSEVHLEQHLCFTSQGS